MLCLVIVVLNYSFFLELKKNENKIIYQLFEK